MGISTEIQWCQATWNPWQGCNKVSPGCKFCYMFREKKRYGKNPAGVVRSAKGTFNAPLRWLRNWQKGVRDEHRTLSPGSRIFVCSWSDFWHKDADAWREEAFEIMRQTPQYIYLIPTKRTERIASHLPHDWGQGWPNVWLGASVEKNIYANKRTRELLSVAAAVHFWSAEPLLEAVDIPDTSGLPYKLDWIIVGGESGPQHRLFDIEWARILRDQARQIDAAFFMKQLGGWPDKQGDIQNFPADIQIREFPSSHKAVRTKGC